MDTLSAIHTRFSVPEVSPRVVPRALIEQLLSAAVQAPDDPRVIEIENICAAAAACQNILLAAYELGLAAQWRTGDAVRDPLVKDFLGFKPEQKVIAFLYIGFPAHPLASYERPGFEERTVWME